MDTQDFESTMSIDNKSFDEITSPEQAKAVHTKLNQYYRKRKQGKRKARPVLRPIGDVETIQKNLTIQKSPTDWDALPNGSLFAVDTAGSLLFTKVSNSRALCLNFMKTQPVGGASCYRIFV